MAFEGISSKLSSAVKKISGKSKVSEKDIDEMLKEVRISLLEADVNYKVVKEFTNEIKAQAYGEKVLKGLNPAQQVLKIVSDELTKLMGEEVEPINFNEKGTTVLMMVGLQGAGKTTGIGKLATHVRKKDKKKPFLIAADIYRPAAIEQLQTIGKQINVPVFEMGTKEKATTIVKEGLKKAKEAGCDFVIIDTAGRLHIDEELMDELVRVKKLAKPDEILLTVDAMTGQDAVNVAKEFHDKLNTTGVMLTKMDGDTRGGAALSIRKISNIPIKFMGTGEKLDQLEAFHPDRVASRILGMGDMMSLIESATENIDEDEALGIMEKLQSGKFNYNDLRKQFKMIKRMGSMSKILGFMPGVGSKLKDLKNVDDSQFKKMEFMIDSMTEEERKNPKLIDSSAKRRERVAKGSGSTVADVNKLRKALSAQVDMMRKMSGMSQSDMERMASSLQNGQLPSGFGSDNSVKKGKGKGKGGFRF